MSSAPESPTHKRKRDPERPSPSHGYEPSRRVRKKQTHETGQPSAIESAHARSATPSDTANKTKRGARGRSGRQKNSHVEQEDGVGSSKRATGQVELSSGKSVKKRKHRSQRIDESGTEVVYGADISYKHSQEPLSGWQIGKPRGGRIIDKRPLMSKDGQRLIVSTDHEIQVYTTSNSLLEQSFGLTASEGDGTLVAATFAADDASHIYTASSTGNITRWHWRKGEAKVQYRTKAPLRSLNSISVGSASRDTLFTTQYDDDQCKVVARRLKSDQSLESKTVLKFNKMMHSLQFSTDGTIAAALTVDSVLIGRINGAVTDALDSLEYTWRDITLTEAPSCLALRVEPQRSSLSDRKAKDAVPNVRLAIGGSRGCIYIFEDMLRKLDDMEKPRKPNSDEPKQDLMSRKLHWHRHAVGALEWTHDGNHLLSGGEETVLVQWNLETGSKDYLPHLESPIRHLMVSSTGTSYVVSLADNSVMVLSTAEKKPIANITGLQSPSTPAVSQIQPRILTVSTLNDFIQLPSSIYAKAIINPKSPRDLLVAVSGYQPSTDAESSTLPTPYLQTYDFVTSRHSSREELTRTIATRSNLAPDGSSILEPDVRHMRISACGSWLATVEQWTPPYADIDIHAGDDADAENALARQREVRLKFWSWYEAEQDSRWLLHATVNKPHEQADGLSSGIIYDLQADPRKPHFATIGIDSSVNIWQPVKVTSKTINAVQKVNQMHLEQEMLEDPLQAIPPDSACLAYSNDRSLLAAYQQFSTHGDQPSRAVHLFNPDEGSLLRSVDVLALGYDHVVSMAFLDRYLICLSKSSIVVWDTVDYITYMQIPLQQQPSDGFQDPLLAVNLATATFAVAAPHTRPQPKWSHSPYDVYQSTVYIFGVQSVSPIHQVELPRLAMSLLSLGGLQSEESVDEDDLTGARRGFLILDAGACARVLTPVSSLIGPAASVADDVTDLQVIGSEQALTNGQVDQASESDSEPDAEPEEATMVLSTTNAVDRAPVHTSEQLRQVFNYPTLAMPHLGDLWHTLRQTLWGKAALPDPAAEVTVAADDEEEYQFVAKDSIVSRSGPWDDNDGDSDSSSSDE